MHRLRMLLAMLGVLVVTTAGAAGRGPVVEAVSERTIRIAVDGLDPATCCTDATDVLVIVEAVLSGDPDRAASLMRKHAIEFGERLIQMEKIYRERKSALAL